MTTTEHADHDAERALLGTILAVAETDREYAIKLVDTSPPPGDYDRPAHEEVAAQLRINAANGDPLEAVAIVGGLNKRKARVGGAPYLHTLVSNATTPASIPYYTERIASAAQLRRAHRSVNRALTRLQAADIDDPGEVRGAVFEAMADLEDIATPTDLIAARSSWRAVDLSPMLDGSYTRPTPAIGQRSDTIPMLYPGKQHAAYGESESGKSWLALLVCLQEMNKAHNTVYFDFEDDPGEIVNRLITMGAHPSRIGEHFHYVRPEEPISTGTNSDIISQILGDLKPSIAVVDGITEAMTLHGYNLKENDEVALFNRAIPGRITKAGAASLVLDHVTKDKETRGRYAIGGQHKLAGLNGAAFIVENRAPFGIGLTGRSALYIAKDRNAALRQHAQKLDDRHWFGDLVVEPLDPSVAEFQVQAYISPPHLSAAPAVRPTILMTKVSDTMKHHNRPLSQGELVDLVGGRSETARRAIQHLITEGNITLSQGARGVKLHSLARPFDPDEGRPE